MKNFKDYINDIIKFYKNNNIKIEPIPTIKLNNTPNDLYDPFISTGSYDYTDQTITLYINNRQCKDILRSFCHELIHHSQYISNPKLYTNMDKSGKLSENPILKKYEADAYLKGNLLFRQWTESMS